MAQPLPQLYNIFLFLFALNPFPWLSSWEAMAELRGMCLQDSAGGKPVGAPGHQPGSTT